MRQFCQRCLLIGLAVVLIWGQAAIAQTDDSPEAPAARPALPLTPNVERIVPVLPPELRSVLLSGEDERVDIARQTVWLDGKRLLKVAAITDDRDETIEKQILSFITRRIDPRSIQVVPKQRGSLTVLEARGKLLRPADSVSADGDSVSSEGDESGEGTAEVITSELLTVTSADAQLLAYSLTTIDAGSQPDMAEALAWSWAKKIEYALVRFKTERQPRFLLQQLQFACAIIVGLLIASMSLRRPKQRLAARQTAIQEQRTAIAQQLSGGVDDQATELSLIQQNTRAQHRQNICSLKQRVLQLGEVALWSTGGFMMVGLVPYTRWLQVLLIEGLRIPGKLLLVVLVTYLLIRLDDILIDRLFVFLQQTPRFLIQDSQRRTLRLSTFSAITKSITTGMFITAGGFAALWVLGVDIGPLIAGAGILGLAVSFAAQSLIRDIINGFLILMEDQYGVGDVVILGDVAGFVENMGLRITQLRNEEGRLITVPNGTINVVQNLTKEWSRVDLTVNVSYGADIDEALEVINTVAQDLDHDPTWGDIILEPPTVLGIDRLSHDGVMVRLWIKTLPLKQWDVAREYRRRLKKAFEAADIAIGTPHQVLRVEGQLTQALSQSAADHNGS